MKKDETINPKFVVNEKGKRISVLLDISEFDALIEELEDLHDIVDAEKIIAQNPETHTLEEVERSLLRKNKR